MWGELVEVVSCDMREWKAPEKADILVSELLGSFGDNELSPECLDGAQRFLNGRMLIFISALFICISDNVFSAKTISKILNKFFEMDLDCFWKESLSMLR